MDPSYVGAYWGSRRESAIVEQGDGLDAWLRKKFFL